MARRSPPRRWTKDVLDETATQALRYGDRTDAAGSRGAYVPDGRAIGPPRASSVPAPEVVVSRLHRGDGCDGRYEGAYAGGAPATYLAGENFSSAFPSSRFWRSRCTSQPFGIVEPARHPVPTDDVQVHQPSLTPANARVSYAWPANFLSSAPGNPSIVREISRGHHGAGAAPREVSKDRWRIERWPRQSPMARPLRGRQHHDHQPAGQVASTTDDPV